MTGVFKWASRKADPDPPVAAATPPAAASKVLPRFVAAVAQQPAPVLLDLGSVVGANVGFFGDRLACKIYVEDLLAEVERHARQGTRDTLAAALPARLTQPPESVDGILCWDLFDYMDRPAGEALAGRLVSLLRPGGALYGFFGTAATDVSHYTRFVVEDENHLVTRAYPATPTTRTAFVTRDIGRLFPGLTVAESVLLKSKAFEVLLRKS